MKPLNPKKLPFGNEPALHNFLGLLDPAPLLPGDGARKISTLIETHADWLRAAPRSSLSIVSHLFPDSGRGIKSALELIKNLSDYLWEACYTPEGTDTYNPTWSWQEGKRLAQISEYRHRTKSMGID